MKARMFCIQCRNEMVPRKETPGHFLIEVMLWMFFIIPGVVYSLWRLVSKKLVCPICTGTAFMPLSMVKSQKVLP